MNQRVIVRCISVLFALAAMPPLQAADAVVTEAMSGHWEGSAHIIMTWCKQKELPITIDIQPDGSVTGKVGDSELTHAQFKRKRNWLGRENDRRTQYIIRGELKGPILAAEGISRREVFIHLRFEGVQFYGSLATSGSKAGGKGSMSLTATPLKLVNAPSHST